MEKYLKTHNQKSISSTDLTKYQFHIIAVIFYMGKIVKKKRSYLQSQP